MMIYRATVTPDFSGSKICHAKLPAGAEIISVGYWKRAISIWAKVDPAQPVVGTPILVVPTGVEHPGDGTELADRFLGRVEITGQELIFHLFTVKAH